MTFEEQAKLKAELAEMSTGSLKRFRRVLLRLGRSINRSQFVGSHAEESLDIIDSLIDEQDEQPENIDV